MKVERGRAGRKQSEWRKGFAEGQTIQRVRPRESFACLRNPHKGTTTFQRFNGDPLYPGNTWSDREGPVEFKPFDGNVTNPRYPDTTMAYCRWIWSVLEPEKGRHRWDIIDGALEAARVRGQTLQVRLEPYASSTVTTPWGKRASRAAASSGGVLSGMHNGCGGQPKRSHARSIALA